MRGECVEIVEIPHLTNEARVCELTEKVTGVNVNQYCLESCHPLPSDKKNDRTIVKFSRRKHGESDSKKPKTKIRTSSLEV